MSIELDITEPLPYADIFGDGHIDAIEPVPSATIRLVDSPVLLIDASEPVPVVAMWGAGFLDAMEPRPSMEIRIDFMNSVVVDAIEPSPVVDIRGTAIFIDAMEPKPSVSILIEPGDGAFRIYVESMEPAPGMSLALDSGGSIVIRAMEPPLLGHVDLRITSSIFLDAMEPAPRVIISGAGVDDGSFTPFILRNIRGYGAAVTHQGRAFAQAWPVAMPGGLAVIGGRLVGADKDGIWHLTHEADAPGAFLDLAFDMGRMCTLRFIHVTGEFAGPMTFRLAADEGRPLDYTLAPRLNGQRQHTIKLPVAREQGNGRYWRIRIGNGDAGKDFAVDEVSVTPVWKAGRR